VLDLLVRVFEREGENSRESGGGGGGVEGGCLNELEENGLRK
jgi:hypothetical protein